MVAVERLGEDDLRDLAQRTDNLGVLSVYLNADPRQDPNLQGAAIDLKNRFRELQQRVAGDAGNGRSRDVAAALARLWPQIELLAGPVTAGRSRIAFAALGADWSLQLESAMPTKTRVVLDGAPFIHPLLELLDEGRPAGVVLVSADGARLLDWRTGVLRPLSRMDREYAEAPYERAGQIGGGPHGQFHTPMREQRQAREDDRMQRFLDRLSGVTAELAEDRGWQRILVSGGGQLAEATVTRFPPRLRDKTCADARLLNRLDDAALAAAVTDWAHQQHAERERRLLDRVRDTAGSGGGALGLSQVAAALTAGRVARLVYDPNVRYAGTVGADGALYCGAEVGPNGRPGTPEPRFTERLIERALQTGARVSPVKGAVETELRDAAGVAALLRW